MSIGGLAGGAGVLGMSSLELLWKYCVGIITAEASAVVERRRVFLQWITRLHSERKWKNILILQR